MPRPHGQSEGRLYKLDAGELIQRPCRILTFKMDQNGHEMVTKWYKMDMVEVLKTTDSWGVALTHAQTHACTCLHSACRKMWMQPTSIKCSRKHGPRWTRTYNYFITYTVVKVDCQNLVWGWPCKKNYLLIMQAHDHRWDSQILVKRWRENGSPIPTKSFLHPIQPTARPPISSGDTSCLLNAMKMVSFCCNVCWCLFHIVPFERFLWFFFVIVPYCACLVPGPKRHTVSHHHKMSQNPTGASHFWFATRMTHHDSPWLTRSAVDCLDDLMTEYDGSPWDTQSLWATPQRLLKCQRCWFDQRWQSQGHSSQLLQIATVLCSTNIWRFRTVSTHNTS